MKQPELVGILNITPDSFSDGGQHSDPHEAVHYMHQLQREGASFVDVGAESTKPGAPRLTADEEWARLEPFLWTLMTSSAVYTFSLDTYHPKTVRRVSKMMSRFIVNDVTGMNNPEMMDAVAEAGTACIVSHLPESHGQDIQSSHRDRVVDTEAQVYDELLSKRAALMVRGVDKNNIILDPGIGFGKTPELNRLLLSFARLVPDIDVMVGYSRKRFLGENRMDIEPNLRAGKIAVAAGTRYLRVHDVAGHIPLLNPVR